MTDAQVDKFWANTVPFDGHRLWMGSMNGGINGDTIPTCHSGYGESGCCQRIAYHLTYGEIPAGQWIWRLCGLERCIEPEHLIAAHPGEGLVVMALKQELRSLFLMGRTYKSV